MYLPAKCDYHKLAWGESNYCDPDAVCSFRYALIRRGIAKGSLQDLFIGTMRYSFRESARKLIEGMQLPAEVRKLYQQCISRTPILSVSPISTTGPNEVGGPAEVR
jgi:hypothetical protein